MEVSAAPSASVSTSVRGAIAPAANADTNVRLGPREEILAVNVLHRPERRTRVSAVGDVLEVVYSLRNADGVLMDGIPDVVSSASDLLSNSKARLGTYFILGAVPSTKLPLALDVALRGMAVGERRLVDTPPCLVVGERGLTGVPMSAASPNAKCDVLLISINGDTTV